MTTKSSTPWLEQRIILLVKAGSHAYGLDSEMSDLDIRGVVVPPKYVRENLFNQYQQESNTLAVHETWKHLANPRNPTIDSVIYSLDKFLRLAEGVNPNILEILFVEDHSILESTIVGNILRRHRDIFLSKRAAFTFMGYAVAQLKRIERHQKWITNPPKAEPTRADFDLPPIIDDKSKGLSDALTSWLKAKVESWNFHTIEMPDESRMAFKQEIYALVSGAARWPVDLDNWPTVYKKAAIMDLAQHYDMSRDMLSLVLRESQWRDAHDQWHNYLEWKANRNQARNELEVKHGYDTKHAMHLVRLLRMGHEILSTGLVFVSRENIDADQLKDIRNGAWTMAEVREYAKAMEAEIKDAAAKSTLPEKSNREKINGLYQHLLSLSGD